MRQPTLTTREIPQADTLENIIDAVEFVSKGYDSYQMIAKKLGLVERQGRYYRLAGELLGLIHNIPHQNMARLTPLGKKFLSSNSDERRKIMFDQIFAVPVVQTVIGILAASGGCALQEEISRVLFDIVTDSTKTMMGRRLQTILSWLGTLGIVTKSGSVVKLVNFPDSINLIEIKDVRLPVLPRIDEPKLFKDVFVSALSNREIIQVEVAKASLERTNKDHEILRNLFAEGVRTCGSISTFNSYVDLAARINSSSIIVEAKILGSNLQSELQKGMSQLSRYKCLQCLPEANGILLVDQDLSKVDSDVFVNLEKVDQHLVWKGKSNELCANSHISEIPFIKVD